jgi:putative pyruvate formate lyase activating enzyme
MGKKQMAPRYMQLAPNELRRRIEQARSLSTQCCLCPRNCRINRVEGEIGFCGVGGRTLLASANLHHGEEPPISGWRGSGTIFFAGCNMRCVFCQNYPISQMRHGRPISTAELVEAMLNLQERGAQNINLVTPSHMTWLFLEALAVAVTEGLKLPIVYNSSGYDGIESLHLLDGIIDIYMPDLKYSSNDSAKRCSGADNYWEVATVALKEMLRQVGHLELDDEGVAIRGMLIRHLVLPENLSGTEKVLTFIAETLGVQTYISLMRQYFPAHRALGIPPLDRQLTSREFEQAVEILHRLGLENGWVQS